VAQGEDTRPLKYPCDLGISMSTYMRQVVLSRPLPSRRTVRPILEVNRETYHALGRLAADINALARRMAERRREPGAPEVLDALELVTPFVGTVRAEVCEIGIRVALGARAADVMDGDGRIEFGVVTD
jgi:mobilization protein NikA